MSCVITLIPCYLILWTLQECERNSNGNHLACRYIYTSMSVIKTSLPSCPWWYWCYTDTDTVGSGGGNLKTTWFADKILCVFVWKANSYAWLLWFWNKTFVHTPPAWITTHNSNGRLNEIIFSWQSIYLVVFCVWRSIFHYIYSMFKSRTDFLTVHCCLNLKSSKLWLSLHDTLWGLRRLQRILLA